MNAISRIVMAGAALALAGCSHLPGANLGGTFTAESYLDDRIEGQSFNAALAREYQALAVRSARTDVNWMDSTAYIQKSRAAAAGGVGPWTPDELGVTVTDYNTNEVVQTIQANAQQRPAACAKAQAYWDQYLESLAEGVYACIDQEDAKAMLDEALAACRGAAGDLVVYFGFDRSDITSAAQAVIDQVVDLLSGYSDPLVSIVGHTDTVGSVAYNQGLSERRATAVEQAIRSRANAEGVDIGNITKAGRSERDLAVPTADGVREPRNRRATIAISE
jgi:outer membrane protein OmpA-like peptidoglycan-associated protein